MNRQERLRRCYFHEELDRPGVFSCAGFPEGDRSYDRLKAYLREHSELKTNWPAIPTQLTQWIYRFSSPVGFAGEGAASVYDMEFEAERYSDSFERQISILHTPGGDLQFSNLTSLDGKPGIEETFLLKTREHAETYLSLPLPGLDPDLSGFHGAVREMGDRGIVQVDLGVNPGGFTARLFGSEAFALAFGNRSRHPSRPLRAADEYHAATGEVSIGSRPWPVLLHGGRRIHHTASPRPR